MGRTFPFLCLGILFLNHVRCSYISQLPSEAQALFNESINWLDTYYDENIGYLYSLSGQTALHHDTRSSVWYAVGLLGRNQGSDVTNAAKIIGNVVSGQYKNPAEQWHDFPVTFNETPC